MNRFLTSNKTEWRLARTIIQGIIGVVMANMDTIFSSLHFSADVKVLIIALTMAVLSPILGAISSNGETIEAYVGGETAGNTETEHEKEDPADAPEEEEAL